MILSQQGTCARGDRLAASSATAGGANWACAAAASWNGEEPDNPGLLRFRTHLRCSRKTLNPTLLVAKLLGVNYTAQIAYDLRRWRLHGLRKESSWPSSIGGSTPGWETLHRKTLATSFRPCDSGNCQL